MIYKCGDYSISIEQIDEFGKNPSLFVSYKNQGIKVASFNSLESAKLFEVFLDKLTNAKPPKEET